MYKHIKSIEIHESKISFELENGVCGIVVTDKPMVFSAKSFEESVNYTASCGYSVHISRSYLTVFLKKKDVHEQLFRFFIPKPVRYLIEKDIRQRDSFTLEYRKHLRSEYDKSKAVIINLNGVDVESYSVLNILKRAEKYSTGIHHQPLVILFDDKLDDVIRFYIVSNNIPVESGYLSHDILPEEQEPSDLPNIFEQDD
jgi:hypothetical protein